jgi:CRISPR-associated protein Cas1
VSVTVDALLLAIENDADIVLMGTDGKVNGRIWHHRFGSISSIRRKQLDFCRDKSGLNWIRRTLIRKIQNQAALLDVIHFPGIEAKRNMAPERLNTCTERIRNADVQSAQFKNTLRGAEAAAGKIYWKAVSAVLPTSYTFKNRSQHPAFDIFNAMLNYAYGILYALCEKALIVAGLDPYLGVLHADMHNRPVLVYDFIESYRHWADYVVVRLCMESAIGPECIETSEKGSCRLNAIGARIVAQCFHDYMAEIVELEKISRARKTHIDLEAQKLAGIISEFKDNP